MELTILSVSMLAAFYLGYKAGKGEALDLIPKKFKPVIRTDEQESELIQKIKNNKR